jgi:outer membrane protein assembly factor BamB
MSISTRRTVVVLLGLGALASLAFLTPVRGQPVQVRGRFGLQAGFPAAPDAGTTDDAQAIQLPTDSRLRKKLDAAQDYMKEESWGEAARILQSLLDAEQDSFVPVPGKDAQGKPAQTMVSVKTEANRLLGTFPPPGLEHYRLSYGATARDLLNQAKNNGDTQLLAQVAQRYLSTDAGVEATSLLGAYNLDRGQFATAALYFERLLDREGNFAKLPPSTLVQAALAFHRLGDRSSADKANARRYEELEENAWKELTAQVGHTVRLGDRTINVTDLRREADQYQPAAPEANPHECRVYRGNPSRTGQGIGDKPFMEKRWSEATMREDASKSLVLEQAVKQAESRNQPVLPAFFPIAADGKLIFRTYWGVAARDLKTGKLAWDAFPAGSLERLLDAREGGNKATYVMQWADAYVKMTKPEMLYENSVVGTLSTDNARVYVVDDLFLPPYAPNMPFNGAMMMPNGRPQQMFGNMSDAAYRNRLQAYDLHGGKLKWDITAGDDKEEKKDGQGPKQTGEVGESYFLGPPLPLHGKLYVLAEKDQELRLVCLEPEKGDVAWSQALATTQAKLSQDVNRRTWAAHLAYGEGVLVCPTNAGMLLGVDLLSHALVWAHPYRDRSQRTAENPGQPVPPFPPGVVRPVVPGMPMPSHGLPGGTGNAWKVTAPVVQDGRVVFTAPDSGSVRCLSLRDGALLWQAAKADDDLYLAGVFDGKVLLVGKKECRALALADGAPLWRLPTGLPSGQGVAAGDLYYLPLKEGRGGEPEVCVLDVARGKDVSHTKSRKREMPGNLLLYEGDVLSQTVQEVAAFPQLKVKLTEIDQRLGKNPQDPVGLTERAELRPSDGNLAGAIDDLRTALKNNPPPETRAKAQTNLYEALTDYLRENFPAGEKYLDEYWALCRVETEADATAEEKQRAAAEEQRRLAAYHWLVAEGRAKQGRLADAFQSYLEFGALAERRELIPNVAESGLKAPAGVLARGRISAMLTRADPEQREALERLIARRWDEVRAAKGFAEMRKFVALFGAESRVGREARFALGERLMKESGTDDLPEAEQQFLTLARQRDDVPLAARATEALARLCSAKGLLEDAVSWYRTLGREFPETAVRDGKTGADLLNDLATDKRFLPYLGEPGQAWSGGKVSVKTEQGQWQLTQQLFTFEPGGDVLPYFQRRRVALESNSHQLRLIDRQTADAQWQTNLTRTQFQMVMMQQGTGTGPRFPYQAVGHTVVLNVGHMVFGLDPVNRKVRWERSLAGAIGTASGQPMLDPRDGTLQITYPDGWVQRLGMPPVVDPSYVCLQTRDGLVALDPVSGETLWTRADVRPRSYLFGDDRHVYLVEANQEGTPISARAFSAGDGVAAKDIPDFSAAFAQRQRLDGGRIFAADKKDDWLALRLYDVPTGKDVWRKDCGAGSLVVSCEDPHLAAVLEPDGALTAVDLRSAREVLTARVDKDDIAKAQGASLLADAGQYYLAINGPREGNAAQFNGPWTNLMPGLGYRSLPVNGKVYAFDKKTGQIHWQTMDVPRADARPGGVPGPARSTPDQLLQQGRRRRRSALDGQQRRPHSRRQTEREARVRQARPGERPAPVPHHPDRPAPGQDRAGQLQPQGHDHLHRPEGRRKVREPGPLDRPTVETIMTATAAVR